MNEKERRVMEAYTAWRKTNPDHHKKRVAMWEKYVALRDGKPLPKRDPETHKDLGLTENKFREVSFSDPLRRRLM